MSKDFLRLRAEIADALWEISPEALWVLYDVAVEEGKPVAVPGYDEDDEPVILLVHPWVWQDGRFKGVPGVELLVEVYQSDPGFGYRQSNWRLYYLWWNGTQWKTAGATQPLFDDGYMTDPERLRSKVWLSSIGDPRDEL